VYAKGAAEELIGKAIKVRAQPSPSRARSSSPEGRCS
jgi:hypothetical protein